MIRRLAPSLASIVLALLVGFIGLWLTRGFDIAVQAYGTMFDGGFGPSARTWGETATKASLLTLTGLSVAVAFHVGLFNIGAQGQMLVGAILAAVVGAHVSLPTGVHAIACLIVAAVGGALYGLIPAALKLWRGVHEVLATIMLNWIALSLIERWLVVGPLRGSASAGHSVSGTDQIAVTAELPRLLGDSSRLHAGILIVVVLAIALWIWLTRTTGGFEVRALGLGNAAAITAGIRPAPRMLLAMATAGALAGLAGALLVQGTEHNYPSIITAPYGFDGIALALIGQNHPLGVLAASVLFGGLRAGGTRLQLLGVHKSFPELLQGLALLLVAGQSIWVALLNWRKRDA